MRTTVPHPSTAIPLTGFLAALCLAGCGGDKSSGGAVQSASAGSPPAAAPAPAAAQTPQGQQVYQRCAMCHGPAGAGVPGSFPPLAGSELATAANPAVPIRVVLKGLSGAVTVKGQKFNGAMPAYGTMQPLSDAEIAAVLTYVRSSWGNRASAVTAEDVAKQRAATASRTTPWTAADLRPLLGGH